ncbi:hypothetical protein ACLOJK_007291, partial [Asimina triloba]
MPKDFSDLESILTEEDNPTADTLLAISDVSDDRSSESEEMYTVEDIPCTPWPLEALTIPVATVKDLERHYANMSSRYYLLGGLDDTNLKQ